MSEPVRKVALERAVARNADYRRVLWTTPTLQLVLMTLRPGETIPAEAHPGTSQFFRLEAGRAEVTTWRGGRAVTRLRAGDSLLVRPGVRHAVRAVGAEPLRLYTLYAYAGAPPHRQGARDRRQP